MRAYAKANLYLKIIGFDNRNYHLINSRFILLKDLYDELFITDEKTQDGFEIISDFKCENNIINKAYEVLCNNGFKEELKEFFKNKSIKLIKNIPTCAGLGGGSSDAALFLKIINEELNLKLNKEKLIQLSTQIGSDLAFFISDFESANVSGCGEIIKEFDDCSLNLNFTFPDISCDTNKVYKEFDKTKYDLKENEKKAKCFENLKNNDLMEFKNYELNDLFIPCVNLYTKMKIFLENNFFLSGSGSSVFKVKI